MELSLLRADPSSTVTLRGDLWNRLAEAVEYACKLEFAPPLLVHDDPSGRTVGANISARPIRFKYTSVQTGSGLYGAKSITGIASSVSLTTNLSVPHTDESLASSEDLLIENAFESGIGGGCHWIDVNTSQSFGEGFVIGSSNASPALPLIRVYVPPPPLVYLTQTGGTAGANSPTPTAASFTYTVKTPGGQTIGTAVAVATARQKGHATAGTRGGVAADASNVLKIMYPDEVIDTTAC